MKKTPDYEGLRRYVFTKLDKELPKNLYFHNLSHTKDVLKVVETLAQKEGINGKGLVKLKTGALIHDAGWLNQDRFPDKCHEEIGAKMNYTILPKFNYPMEDIPIYSDMTIATKIPQTPKSILEKILCDADVFNFGREDFFEKGDLLRKELATKGVVFTDLEWYKNSLKLLEGHNFWTASARNITKVQKAENIEILKERISKL
jgi:hypothetical protein